MGNFKEAVKVLKGQIGNVQKVKRNIQTLIESYPHPSEIKYVARLKDDLKEAEELEIRFEDAIKFLTENDFD